MLQAEVSSDLVPVGCWRQGQHQAVREVGMQALELLGRRTAISSAISSGSRSSSCGLASMDRCIQEAM